MPERYMSVITDGMVNLSQHQLSRYLRKAEGQKVIGSDTKNATL